MLNKMRQRLLKSRCAVCDCSSVSPHVTPALLCPHAVCVGDPVFTAPLSRAAQLQTQSRSMCDSYLLKTFTSGISFRSPLVVPLFGSHVRASRPFSVYSGQRSSPASPHENCKGNKTHMRSLLSVPPRMASSDRRPASPLSLSLRLTADFSPVSSAKRACFGSAYICQKQADTERKTVPTVAAERRLEECNYTSAAAHCKTCRHALVCRHPAAIVLRDLSELLSACGPDASSFFLPPLRVPLLLLSHLQSGRTWRRRHLPRLSFVRLFGVTRQRRVFPPKFDTSLASEMWRSVRTHSHPLISSRL